MIAHYCCTAPTCGPYVGSNLERYDLSACRAGTALGGQCVAKCSQGYTENVQQTLTCARGNGLNDAVWSGNLPSCTGTDSGVNMSKRVQWFMDITKGSCMIEDNFTVGVSASSDVE
jgi:hypothetical protein